MSTRLTQDDMQYINVDSIDWEAQQDLWDNVLKADGLGNIDYRLGDADDYTVIILPERKGRLQVYSLDYANGDKDSLLHYIPDTREDYQNTIAKMMINLLPPALLDLAKEKVRGDWDRKRAQRLRRLIAFLPNTKQTYRNLESLAKEALQ